MMDIPNILSVTNVFSPFKGHFEGADVLTFSHVLAHSLL